MRNEKKTGAIVFKSRNFWIAISGLILLLIVPPVVCRFWWYPNTLRARFDRIEMGMTETEVKEILGEPNVEGDRIRYRIEDGVLLPYTITVYEEDWTLENGKVRRTYWNSKTGGASPWEAGCVVVLPPLIYEYNNTFIRVHLNGDGKVYRKFWEHHVEEKSPLDRFRQWLPFSFSFLRSRAH